MTDSRLVPLRLAYEAVDDAVMDPATAVLQDGELRVSGCVEAGGLLVKFAQRVPPRRQVPMTLVIASVTRFHFERLDDGTGDLIVGDFRPHAAGGLIEGVIPGELVFESDRTPQAWFETTALAQNGDAVEFRFNV